MFQFQTGAIRRRKIEAFRMKKSRFQFQTGAIRSGEKGADWIEVARFQFQTGSIKRGTAVSVRLEFFAVSIPNWFD